MIKYRYTDKEITELLKHLTIIMDTREKESLHIVQHFNKKNIPYKIRKLDVGDYSMMIPYNEETAKLGVPRDLYFDSFIERKNGVDEIIGNLVRNNGTTFENELIRAKGKDFVLFVEDLNFNRKVALGEYISKYDKKALKGRIESLKAKYKFEICQIDKEMMGFEIYERFKQRAKYFLKNGTF